VRALCWRSLTAARVGNCFDVLSQMHASTSRAVLARPAPVRSLRAAPATRGSSRSALKVRGRSPSSPLTCSLFLARFVQSHAKLSAAQPIHSGMC